ncbi:LuxR family transcriptional regulator [Kutzneria viridogrisea]|uniref:DNA-binding CsgD family transcriptional regulator/energy-coupling factor transporter ATP-binding protein EcfA2 n=1 Tax=Kutzneria viridogrisea TaxID=47990 RepID=A0ABR6BKD9_9PSEU|nr:DNA-binding CsgD family transcriptional regulator/energy-coupling factor transporter ATP-binding protein EcfA2 [Kutzneria viridogrisea]
MNPHGNVLGRREVLARCRAGLAEGGVLLHGPAGVGKSTLLDALAAEAAEEGELVLRSTPGATEVMLPHVALIDLFGPHLNEYGQRLSGHLRSALDTALLRTSTTHGSTMDMLAVRLAVVDLLRVLAADRPVLLALDDVQWLDQASLDVLRFAARRIGGHRVRVLVAERAAPGAELVGTAVCPPPVSEIELDGVPDGVIAELLRSRLGLALTGTALSRVRKASGGNPFYALELGRMLQRGGSQSWLDRPLPVPDRLRSLVADRLASLPEQCRPVLLAIAADGEVQVAGDPAVTAAVEAGVLVVSSDGTIRFSHPLLAELVYGDASPAERRRAHELLASHVDDPLRQARHRALATVGADPLLAKELLAAATLARGRGAPAAAAELCRLAASHTPADDPEIGLLWLEAARHAYAAGLTDDARFCCQAAIRGVHHEARVRARLLLWELAGHDKSAVAPLLEAAAEDAGDEPGLVGWVHRYRAELAVRQGRPLVAVDELVAAQEFAEMVRDQDLLLQVLALRIPIELQRDEPLAWELVLRANLAADGVGVTQAAVHARLAAVVTLLRRGQTDEAVDAAAKALSEVERSGRMHELCSVLYACTSVHERAGLCARAAEFAETGGLLRADIEPTPGPGLTMRAAGQLNTGTAEAAAELLDAAIASGEHVHDREWLAYALGMRGRAHVLLREYEPAVRVFDRARTTLHDIGYQDPAFFMIDADLAECLALTGEPGQAGEIIKDARARADRMGRWVVRLGLDRAEALLGDSREAADRLRAALPERHPYPLELARAWLALSTVERRARRRAAATAAARRALDLFTGCGCVPWQRFAEHELARLSAADTPVTDAEQRLIELVRSGATNRQIAVDLYLSVKAVEASLTRLYRKFGVHNRAELLSVTESAT